MFFRCQYGQSKQVYFEMQKPKTHIKMQVYGRKILGFYLIRVTNIGKTLSFCHLSSSCYPTYRVSLT